MYEDKRALEPYDRHDGRKCKVDHRESLYASLEDAQYLDPVLWNELCECNQNSDMQRRLPAVLHVIKEHDIFGGSKLQPIEDGGYKVWDYDANQDKLESLHASP